MKNNILISDKQNDNISLKVRKKQHLVSNPTCTPLPALLVFVAAETKQGIMQRTGGCPPSQNTWCQRESCEVWKVKDCYSKMLLCTKRHTNLLCKMVSDGHGIKGQRSSLSFSVHCVCPSRCCSSEIIHRVSQ